MDIFNLLSMIGGLAMFLYGMKMLGDGLSKMAGGRLEEILERLTTSRLLAVLLGAGVTAIIQSSSATTVMVVGFVNSGIMKLSQAVGIIMGANVGTTITSWMLSLTGIDGGTVWLKLLKPSSFSPVLAAIGIVLLMSAKGESKKKDAGVIMLGFAILMFGMEEMSGSVSGLAHNPSFTSLMTSFANPILGMSVGAILTAIIQSSSASVGILQALCSTGAVSVSVALPIIMGQNIGTCVTSIISSIGANTNARRAALIHLFFNMIGTAVFMVVFYALNFFLRFAFMDLAANAAGIALIHSLFNIGAVILLFPFANSLVKLTEKVIPENKMNEENGLSALKIDERFLSRPAFAMELCRQKARDMAELTDSALRLSMEAILNYDAEKIAKVKEIEQIADQYEDVLGSYLLKLSSRNISDEDSRSMSIILHSISDFERISDRALDITDAAEELEKKKLSFSPAARAEIETLCRAVSDISSLTINSFKMDSNELAVHVGPLDEVIDSLTKEIKENHIKRLQKGECSIEMGFVLEDILMGLKRSTYHYANVAFEILAIHDGGQSARNYFDNYRNGVNDEFRKLIEKYPIGKVADLVE